MLNLKKLLNKITSAIVELTDWKDNTTTLLAQAADYGTGYSNIHSSDNPVSVKTGTHTNVGHITLPPGKYIAYSRIYFPTNGTGSRLLSMGGKSGQVNDRRVTSPGTDDGALRLMCWYSFELSTTTDIYAVAFQSSGSTMSITASGLYAFKTGNI